MFTYSTGKENNEVTLIGLVSERNRSWEKGACLCVNTLEIVHLYVILCLFLNFLLLFWLVMEK